MINILSQFLIGLVLGIMAAFIAVAYRNVIRPSNMILRIWFEILERMANSKNLILSFIAYPLGFCPYCNSIWVGIISYNVVRYLENLPFSFVALVTTVGVTHIISSYLFKNLLKDNADLQTYDPQIDGEGRWWNSIENAKIKFKSIFK